MTPNQPFEVLASAAVAAALRELLERTKGTPRHEEIVTSFRVIHDDLRAAPMQIGEDRDYLPHLELTQRIGFRGPLIFRYSVNLKRRTVWLQSVRLYPGM